MTPSFVASLISFIIAGGVVLWSSKFAANQTIHWYIMGTIILNALYFYYLNATAEFSKTLRPYNQGRLDWLLTVFQYSLVYTMWFAIQLGAHVFSIVVIIIYLTYISWDYAHRKRLRSDKKNLGMVAFDIAGFVLAVVLACLTWTLPTFDKAAHIQAGANVAGVCMVFMVKSALGIIYTAVVFRYWPFRMLTNAGAAAQASIQDSASATSGAATMHAAQATDLPENPK